MILIIYSALISLLNIITNHILLTRKKSVIFCVFTYIINTILAIILTKLAQKAIHDPAVLKLVTFFIAFMYIIYIHIIFKESFSKKIFNMFSIWMFSSGLLLCLTSLANVFLRTADKVSTQHIVGISRIFIHALFLLILYFKLSKTYKKVLSTIPDKTINFMSLYPVIALVLLISDFSPALGSFNNFHSRYGTLLFFVFVSLGYILVFAGISASSKIISFQYNYKIIENQVELQRQNYNTLIESMNQLYALKHDVRHHISAMEIMVQQKQYSEALSYIKEFNEKELSKTLPLMCNNFAADSIIKFYMSLAISKNIKFKTNIMIPEDIGINSLDLCIVLGNSLENAIDACDKLSSETKKHIEFTSKIHGSHIIFMITNSFNGKIVKVDNIIKSSKEPPSQSIGLSSIRETVHKYNGNVNIKYSKDTFEITIIMSTHLLTPQKPVIESFSYHIPNTP